MTSGIDCLSLREQDARLMVAAQLHVGARNADFQMEPYVFGRTKAGMNILNLKKTWEKIVLAARAIAAVENPADVFAIANNVHAQRAVLKFAKYTGATAIAGRYTPGTLTNQIQAAFREPRLIVVSCPRADHQPISEARYVSLPVIAFSNSDASLRHVDIGVPCNNKSVLSIGLAWWLLTRQVLRIRGTISYETEWDVMPDLFFYRTPEEQEKEQKEEGGADGAGAGGLGDAAAGGPPPPAGGGVVGGGGATEDWGEPVAVAASTAPAATAAAGGGGGASATAGGGGASAGGFGAVGQPSQPTGGDDWGAAVTDDSWGGGQAAGATDWGASAVPDTNWG